MALSYIEIVVEMLRTRDGRAVLGRLVDVPAVEWM